MWDEFEINEIGTHITTEWLCIFDGYFFGCDQCDMNVEIKKKNNFRSYVTVVYTTCSQVVFEKSIVLRIPCERKMLFSLGLQKKFANNC